MLKVKPVLIVAVAGLTLVPYSCRPATPDNEPPSVALVHPPAGATVSGSVKMIANVNDNSGSVACVDFFVNEGLLYSRPTPPWEWPFHSDDVCIGDSAPFTLWVRAQDSAGNTGVSQQVPVTVWNPDLPLRPDRPAGPPGECSTYVYYIFTTKAPLPIKTRYSPGVFIKFDWGDGDTSNWVFGFTGGDYDTTTFVARHVFRTEGIRYVRALAFNAAHSSDWSEPLCLNVWK